ncbi:MAG: ribosome small subunit-dependent GTPase A [Planctomycetes bacterium]|nr:ribosome small subunit-dependent GTPase A [Planctomycetota bacterium]
MPAGPSKLEGVVVRKSSRELLVETETGRIACVLRGRLRSLGEGQAPAVVGDRVVLTRLSEKEGVLEDVLPRRSELVRGTAEGEPLVVAANLDRFLILVAAREPPPRWALVDRMLVAAERQGLEPGIGINKWDQVRPGAPEAREIEGWIALYRDLGYATFPVSALERTGLEALAAWLQGKTTVVAGHSGVGKSTLLNALDPALEIQTAEVNRTTGKGRQTTTAVSLYRLPFGGHVADTPGFREFLPADLGPPELGRHYREFLPHLPHCRYADCLHREEPRCGVRDAVAAGVVSKARYDNYLQILATLPEPR